MQKSLDLSTAKIVRVKSPDGTRLGAYIKRAGLPDLPLNVDGLKKLSAHLSDTKQKISGAYIRSDGRVYGDSKSPVIEVTRKAEAFAAECAASMPCKKQNTRSSGGLSQISQSTQSKPIPALNLRGRVDRDASTMLRAFGIEPDVTEHRLMSVLCAGLELLYACKVETDISDVRHEQERRGRYAKYLRVSVICPSIESKYMREVAADVYLNGTVDLTVWEAATYAERLIRCKCESDIRNAILWLCVDSGNCSDKIHAEYSKYQRDAELLMAESDRPTPIRPQFSPIMLPHKPICHTLREHIKDLDQLRIQLERLFGGEYVFTWRKAEKSSNKSANLSVAKRALSP